MAMQDPWHKFAEAMVLQTPHSCGNPCLIFKYASHVHAHKSLESMDMGTSAWVRAVWSVDPQNEHHLQAH